MESGGKKALLITRLLCDIQAGLALEPNDSSVALPLIMSNKTNKKSNRTNTNKFINTTKYTF
jgi:hypothetical protein